MSYRLGISNQLIPICTPANHYHDCIITYVNGSLKMYKNGNLKLYNYGNPINYRPTNTMLPSLPNSGKIGTDTYINVAVKGGYKM